MSLSKETQQEISQIYESVAQYFASAGVSQDYYENSNQELTGLQKSLDENLNQKKKKQLFL